MKHLSISAFIGIFLLCTVFTASAQYTKPALPPEPDWDEKVQLADSVLANGEYARTVELLNNFPASDTSYANAMYLLAMGYTGLEKFQEAVDCALKGLNLRSRYKRLFYEVLGAAYDGLDQTDKSMAYLKEGQKEFPTYTRFWFQMGVTSRHAKKYEEAAQYFQLAIRANPFHSSAHLNLGILMYNSNRMIPALLSYYTFLLMDADADKSIGVLREIEHIGNGEYKISADSMWIKTPPDPNSFTDLEALINSKWALNPAYKSKVNLSYTTIVKTLQILGEKLEYQAADTGFYMRFYVPFIQEMVKAGVYDASIYFCFRSLEKDEVRKELKKQENNIEKMKTTASDFLNKYRKEQWMALKLAKNDPWFNTNGIITSDAIFNEKIKLHTGDFQQYWNTSKLRSDGKINSNGKLNGQWKYYTPEGDLHLVKYFKDDLLVDSAISYFPSGAIEQVTHYAADKPDGIETAYYKTGGVKTKIGYTKGVVSGDIHYWHENGQKELDAVMVNDKPNGKMVSFHGNGVHEKEQVFKNGMLNGPYKSWYENGMIESEGTYVNGNKDGAWKFYHETGGIDNEGSYKNGEEEGPWKSYFKDGKIQIEQTYVGGKNDGESKFYDEDGKLWSKFNYSKGTLKKFSYSDKQGKVISSGELKGNKLELHSHYPNGMKFRDRNFVDNNLDGPATTWNKFGFKEEIEQYKDDQLDGKQQYFYDSGDLRVESNYREGERNGLYTEYFSNGVVSVQGWHRNGKRRGMWYEYRADGSIEESYYYQDGEFQGDYTIYDVKGKPKSIIGFDHGDIISYSGVDTTGKQIYSYQVVNGKASFETKHANQKPEMVLRYKNGSLDGEIKSYYCNGKPAWLRNYKNGEKNGISLEYDWDGSMTDSSNYVDGDRDSIYSRFENGKLFMRAHYSRGDLHGIRTWYHSNGQVETEGNFVHGQQEGYFSYYDETGALRYRLLFLHGDVISYSYQAADGSFVPEIPIPAGTGDLKSFFSNGKPSATYSYKCGYYHGPYVQYHSNGKVAVEYIYNLHEKEGIQKEFNQAGQLIKEEHYLYDYKNGVCKYYNNGIIQRESNYVMGSMHGPTMLYDKTGKLSKKINMYNDQPCN